MAHRESSPRKTVPLASGDDRPQSIRSRSGPSFTKRVFFCGVVVENSGYGRELPPDVQELVASLGDPMDLDSDASILSGRNDSSTDPSDAGDGPHARKRAMTDSSALKDVINEFVSTEQSYVNRLQILKKDYADPLRIFSRNKSTALIAPYEAKTLFGNIDQLLPVNQAFRDDLERMMLPDGPQTVGGIGDVALKHFKEYRGFEHYKQYYSKREEAQAIFEKEVRKGSGFAAFIDRIKYSSSDTKNRVGLRELLMDPVQRIPRYTLLFRTMIKLMAPHDPQRAKLLEADEIASKIAQAETDDQTKRAAIMYCLGATVEDFPPALISNSRRFVDCIDVEDVISDTVAPLVPSASGQALGNLHCTLFLFDDKLIIVKRPGNGEKGGRMLSGLDDLDKLAKSGGLPMGLKKSGMVCKGVVDVTDVVVTDVGGSDFHIYLETPPEDQGDRWSGRPFRVLSVVNPPAPVNLDPTRTEADKLRFLESLWSVQARFRTRQNQSVLLCTDDREVESRGSRTTFARTYFNVYQRTGFLKETKKTKVVLHIDHEGSADPIPFGIRGSPFVIVRVQPMAGELSRYMVTSSDPGEEPEEDIVQTGRVPDRIVQTIHQYGLFKFRTGINSMPSTPTVSRSRAAKFGLDAISRNLFNALPGAAKGDLFGGSISSHIRSRTTGSRSSVYTQSTSTGDGSLTRFSRSNSTVTSATSVSLMDDEHGMGSQNGSTNSKRSRSLSKAKKLIQRGKSPGGSGGEEPSPRRSGLLSRLSHSTSSLPDSRSRSPSLERGTGTDASDWEEEETFDMRAASTMDQSERDLAARLELARRNSKNQNESRYALTPIEAPLEDTIYEEEPPQPIRPASRASRASRDLPDIPDGQSQRSTTPRPTTPSNHLYAPDDSPPRRARSTSRHSAERRPLGPRSPSPMPLALHVDTNTTPSREDVEMDDDVYQARGRETTPSPLPRSKRQPFEPVSNTEATPKASVASSVEETPTVEPLSIKKKASVRTGESPTKQGYQVHRSSPLLKPTSRLTSEKRSAAQSKQSKIPVPASQLPAPVAAPAPAHVPTSVFATAPAPVPAPTIGPAPGPVPGPVPEESAPTPYLSDSYKEVKEAERLLIAFESTKEDLESAQRAVKRIKLEVEQARYAGPSTSSPGGEMSRPSSPVKGLRTAPWASPPAAPTREAQARMEEMQRLIGRRLGESTPRTRPLSMVGSASLSRLSDDTSSVHSGASDTALTSIDEFAAQAEGSMNKAIKSHGQLLAGFKSITSQLKERTSDVEMMKLELQGAKRQTDLLKDLVDDCIKEKEIMYEAFNEELDGMFDDAGLPEEEAWAAMTRDLRHTKETRNALSKENSNLKRKLAQMEAQNDEYVAILRAHGLLSSSS